MQWFLDKRLCLENQSFAIASSEMNRSELQEYLASLLVAKDDPYIYDIYFTSTENVMASGTGYDNLAEDPDIDYRQRQWYLKSSVTDDVIYSTAYRDLDTDNIVITMSRRVMRDELLKGAADCMKLAFDKNSKIYRMGGDEFSVIIHGDVGDAHKMLSRFDAETAAWQGDIVKKLAVSYGFVASVEHPELSFDEMAALADELMYTSKAEYYRREGVDRRRRDD